MTQVFRVLRYTEKSKILGSLLVPFGFVYGLYKWRRWSMVASIDASLERGTRPNQLTSVAAVDRSELEKDIRRKFIDVGKDTARFGVILGPSGTGKTFITRKAVCTEPTSGALYFEVDEPLFFATDLADTVGLRWKPGFLDAVFEKFLPSKHLTYYKMPEGSDSLSTGISFVLDVLEERAARSPFFGAVEENAAKDRSPVLILDGVDLLAKENPRAFIKLVDRCKFHSNSAKLRIVLASSEGKVMPLINETSAKTRAFENVMEVLDIKDEEASQYLVKRGMEESLSKHVAEFMGGRFVYLDGAIGFMKDAKRANPQIGEDELYDEIKRRMINAIVNPCLDRAKAAGKEKQLVLKYLFHHDHFYVNELMTTDDKWNDRLSETVDTLVHYNLLRYDREGKVTWHSNLVKNTLLKKQ